MTSPSIASAGQYLLGNNTSAPNSSTKYQPCGVSLLNVRSKKSPVLIINDRKGRLILLNSRPLIKKS